MELETIDESEEIALDVFSVCCICNIFIIFILIVALIILIIYFAIKVVLVNTLGLIILFAMSLVNHMSSDCCKIENVIYHVCIGLNNEVNLPGHKLWGLVYNTEYWIRNDEDKTADKCMSRFCNDFHSMKTSDFYCGVGQCNVFGCSCNDSCRKSNNESFERFEKLFALDHGFVQKSRNKLF